MSKLAAANELPGLSEVNPDFVNMDKALGQLRQVWDGLLSWDDLVNMDKALAQAEDAWDELKVAML